MSTFFRTSHLDYENWIKDEIWKHYNVCIENTGYGMVPDDGFSNELEANKAYFGFENLDDTFKSVNLDEVFSDISFIDFRYFNLIFECPWEGEHGISIGIKNGNLDSIY